MGDSVESGVDDTTRDVGHGFHDVRVIVCRWPALTSGDRDLFWGYTSVSKTIMYSPQKTFFRAICFLPPPLFNVPLENLRYQPGARQIWNKHRCDIPYFDWTRYRKRSRGTTALLVTWSWNFFTIPAQREEDFLCFNKNVFARLGTYENCLSLKIWMFTFSTTNQLYKRVTQFSQRRVFLTNT